MLSFIFSSEINTLLGMAFSIGLCFLLLFVLRDKLPQDQGRAFAVEGQLSKGKARGAGIIFVAVFCLIALLFDKGMNVEKAVYLVIILLTMLTGYFDDASKTPWNEYVKGALDLVLAIGVAVNYLYHNGNSLYIGFLGGMELSLPIWLYGILIIALVWASINVVNCTDGVDGLSSALTIVTLGSFYLTGFLEEDAAVLFFICVLLPSLWFNSNPSSSLMGDAGSRAMGMMIAITALLCKHPLLFLPFTIVMILDGGLGLIKVSLLRFLKISILKNTKCPLHDHYRKTKGWSNTQVDYRFVVTQFIVSGIYLAFIRIFN